MSDQTICIIGVDAQTLAGPLTGIKRYTANILELLSQKENIKLILYSSKPISYKFSAKDNINIRAPKKKFPMPYILWLQLIFPMLIIRDNVGVYWAPSHRASFIGMLLKPCVVTIHDIIYRNHGYTMPVFSKILDSIFIPSITRLSKRILTVSNSTKLDLIHHLGVSSKKVSVTHLAATNFIDGPSPEREKKCENKSFILFVGTFEPRKNIEKLIQAFSLSEVCKEKNINLVLLGEIGWGKINPEYLAIKFGVEKKVNVISKVNDETLKYHYENCIFLALPSLWEGFGLPIVEAFKFGKPVLVSNRASMPEIAQNGGILVDPDDTMSIKNGIEKFFEKNRYNRLAKNSKTLSKKYSWEKTAHLTEKVLLMNSKI